LAKISYLFIGAACVPLLAVTLAVRGHRRLALALALGWVGSFLLGWVLTGQRLAHLRPFVIHGFAMSRAYEGALGFEALPLANSRALVVAGLLLVLLLLRVGTAFDGTERKSWLLRGLLFAWLSLLTFSVWKHGFVRAYAGYLSLCFIYVAVLSVALEMFGPSKALFKRWDSLLTGACWLLSLATAQFLAFPGFPKSVVVALHSTQNNLHWLLRPGEALRRVHRDFETTRPGAQLPQCKGLIGGGSVDVFGYRQAFALLNEFNYRPRPDLQSYGACNPHMMRLNEQFFLSKAAPEYVLFELAPMDRKWPVLEDGYVLRHLLINYEPIADEKHFLLMKARSADPPNLKLLREGTLRPGQPIDLTQYGEANLWLKIDLAPSLLGRLQQFLTRPPPVRLAAWREPQRGLILRRRAPPCMLSAGFLATPLIQRNQDVLDLYAARPMIRPRAYSLELAPGTERFWQPSYRYWIYSLQNPIGPRQQAKAQKS
jgi:hypothetical protein